MAKPALVYSTSGKAGKAVTPNTAWHIRITDPRNGLCVACCSCGWRSDLRTYVYGDSGAAFDKHASGDA